MVLSDSFSQAAPVWADRNSRVGAGLDYKLQSLHFLQEMLFFISVAASWLAATTAFRIPGCQLFTHKKHAQQVGEQQQGLSNPERPFSHKKGPVASWMAAKGLVKPRVVIFIE